MRIPQSPTENSGLSSASTPSTLLAREISIADLFSQFDKTLEGCLEDEWKGTITMELDRNACGILEPIDICEHLGKSKHESSLSDKLYFDRTKFPPPQSDDLETDEDRATFGKLKTAIRRWSVDGGSKVVSNGNGGITRCRRFKCSYCYRVYNPLKKKKKVGFAMIALLTQTRKEEECAGNHFQDGLVQVSL